MKKSIATSILAFGLLTTSLTASENICQTSGLTVSIEEGTKLSQTLINIADTCKYTIIYADEETAKEVKNTSLYSINIYDKNIDEMFDILLHKNNLNYTIENGVVTIAKTITKTFRVDFIDMIRTGASNANIQISAASSGGSGGGGGASGDSGASIDTQETVDFWSKLEENIAKIVVRPEDKEKTVVEPIINRKSGLVTVSGTYKQLERVKAYLDTLLETVTKQVLIDVKVIAVDLNKNEESGVDWSKFSLGLNSNNNRGTTDYQNVNQNGDSIYSASLNPATDLANTAVDVVENVKNFAFTMEGMINFLNNYGDSKTMASPKVLALNNQPTLISVGDNINYLIKSSSTTATAGGAVGGESETPSSLFVGVLLDITPHIDENDRITLKINPSISELKYAEDGVRQTAARNLPPDTTTRRISTVINMGDGETFVLGGLINQRVGKTNNKVDILGDIPVLGKLFSYESDASQKTEIVFIITAKIIDPKNPLSMEEAEFKTAHKAYDPKKHILVNISTKDLEKVKKQQEQDKKELEIKKAKYNDKKTKQEKIEINNNSPFSDFQ
jgi:general secretion pathway protein D